MTELEFLEILESCDNDRNCGGGYIANWNNDPNNYENYVIDGKYNITLLLQKLGISEANQ